MAFTDLDQMFLISDNDGGKGAFALIEDYTLPSDGTYRIVARGWGGQAGSYELTLTLQ